MHSVYSATRSITFAIVQYVTLPDSALSLIGPFRVLINPLKPQSDVCFYFIFDLQKKYFVSNTKSRHLMHAGGGGEIAIFVRSVQNIKRVGRT
jgi:hypothetical protein